MLRLVREIAASGVRIVLSSHLLRDVETVLRRGDRAQGGPGGDDRRPRRGAPARTAVPRARDPRRRERRASPRRSPALGCEVAELPNRTLKVVLPDGVDGARRSTASPASSGVQLRRLTQLAQLARAPVPEGDGGGRAPCRSMTAAIAATPASAARRAALVLDAGALRPRRGLRRSRASLLMLFILACLPVLVFAGVIYLANNLDLLTALGVQGPGRAMLELDGDRQDALLLVPGLAVELRVPARLLRRADAGRSRPRPQRAAALPVAPDHARRLHPRQAPRSSAAALGSDLGAGAPAACCSRPRSPAATGSRANCAASRRRSSLGSWIWISAPLALRARDLGLGPLATGRHRRCCSASSSSARRFGTRDRSDRRHPLGEAPRCSTTWCRRSGSTSSAASSFLGWPVARGPAAGRRLLARASPPDRRACSPGSCTARSAPTRSSR